MLIHVLNVVVSASPNASMVDVVGPNVAWVSHFETFSLFDGMLEGSIATDPTRHEPVESVGPVAVAPSRRDVVVVVGGSIWMWHFPPVQVTSGS